MRTPNVVACKQYCNKGTVSNFERLRVAIIISLALRKRRLRSVGANAHTHKSLPCSYTLKRKHPASIQCLASIGLPA